MNYAVVDFTVNKAVTLSGDAVDTDNPHGVILLSSADAIVTNGKAQTVTDNETIHGGGTIGDGFMTLKVGAAGIIDADSATNGMMLQTTGRAVSNAGTIEATDGGWLRISHTTVTDTATAHITVDGTNSLLDLDTATINGGIVSVTNGGILAGVAGTTSTINASTSVADSGMVEAYNGSHLVFTGAVMGSGTGFVSSDGLIDFGAASSLNVNFNFDAPGDNSGTLVLEKATSAAFQFTGAITNFVSGYDVDLGAISFTGSSVHVGAYDGTNTTVTVSDATHHIDLKIASDFTLSNFTLRDDGHGHADLLLA